jgi:non-heme chloroperoxidase
MPAGPDYPRGFPANAVEAVTTGWRTDFVRWIDENKRGFFTPETSQALVDWGGRLMESMSLYVQLEISTTTANLDLRDDLREFRLPTLLIHGDRDESVPVDFSVATAALLPNARFERYPDAAHGVFITHSMRVHTDMLAFIQAAVEGKAA